MKRLSALILTAAILLCACGEAEEPPVNGDTNGTNAANGTNAENGETPTPPTNGENGTNGDQTPPRPRSEWTLYINGEETDVYVEIFDRSGFNMPLPFIPVKDVVSLFGGETSYWKDVEDYDGTDGFTAFINGMPNGSAVNGDGTRDIDGVIYSCSVDFINGFDLGGFELFQRVCYDRKIIHLDEVEVPWIIYVDGAQIAIKPTFTSATGEFERRFGLMQEISLEWFLSVPFEEFMLSLGAEFVDNGEDWNESRDMNYNGKGYRWGYYSYYFGDVEGKAGHYLLTRMEMFFSMDFDFGERIIYFVSL